MGPFSLGCGVGGVTLFTRVLLLVGGGVGGGGGTLFTRAGLLGGGCGVGGVTLFTKVFLLHFSAFLLGAGPKLQPLRLLRILGQNQWVIPCHPCSFCF